MADAIPVFMSSRRTVMSGEVVTFATRFEPWDSAFGKTYRAAGPFDVSASRDAVMVHHAECKNREESLALALAVTLAEQVRAALAPHQRGGHPSQYPSEPTLCAPDGVRRGEMAALSRQPVAWRREFDGDVSDQGHWLYTEDEADTQDGYSWQPLFLQPPTEEELRAGLELFKRIATRGVATDGGGKNG